MATKKKKDQLTADVRNLRREIREKIEGEFSREYAEAQRAGKYPWEGLWLSTQDIERLQKKLLRKDRVVLIEVCILLICMSFFSYAFYWILKWLFLPK